MAALTHYFRLDPTGATLRSTASTTQVEETNWTITWAQLTGAGFANGDVVTLVIGARLGASTTSISPILQIGYGTTYAGRTSIASSLCRAESNIGSGYPCYQYHWIGQITLSTNLNIYFSTAISATGTAYYANFQALFLKLGDLSANDYAFAEATHSGMAPTSYDTSGASVSIPATGDWLILSGSRWNIDSTTTDLWQAIYDGAADISELHYEGENTSDQYCMGTVAYKAGLSSGTTVRTRYHTEASGHECLRTSILCLRLNAFEDHWGSQTTNVIALSAYPTYATYASNAAYSKTSAGPFVVLGHGRCTTTGAGQQANIRTRIGGTQWPTTYDDWETGDNGGSGMKIGSLSLVYGANESSGSKNIVLDASIAEGSTLTSDSQTSAIFSLTLSSAAQPFTLTATGFAQMIVFSGAPIICPAGF